MTDSPLEQPRSSVLERLERAIAYIEESDVRPKIISATTIKAAGGPPYNSIKRNPAAKQLFDTKSTHMQNHSRPIIQSVVSSLSSTDDDIQCDETAGDTAELIKKSGNHLEHLSKKTLIRRFLKAQRDEEAAQRRLDAMQHQRDKAETWYKELIHDRVEMSIRLIQLETEVKKLRKYEAIVDELRIKVESKQWNSI